MPFPPAGLFPTISTQLPRRAPGSQQVLDGDSIATQRNWSVGLSGYNNFQLPNNAATGTNWWTTGFCATTELLDGPFSELIAFFEVEIYNAGNSAMLLYIDTMDAYGDAYHLFAGPTGGMTALTKYGFVLGSGLSASTTTLQGSTSAIVGPTETLTPTNLTYGGATDSTIWTAVNIPFGDTLRFSWAYTATTAGAAGPAISFSTKRK